MHKVQYDKLRHELRASVSGIVPETTEHYLHITAGRHKGRLGRVMHMQSGFIRVRCDDDTMVTYPYTKLEQVDAHGAPLYRDALDITGRPIIGSSVLCYSVSVGPQAHALEIGRVVKTNPSGTLTVQPMIRNGKPLKSFNGGAYRTRSMVRAERAIVLPVEATLVITWVLSSFEVYQDGELLR